MKVKAVTFKIFHPGNKKFDRMQIRTPRGKAFTPEGIEIAIRRACDKAEELHPGHEYDLVPVGRHMYNIVWVKALEVADEVSTART